MNKISFLTGVFILSAFLHTSCRKNNAGIIDTPVDETNATPMGSPIGSTAHKMIGDKGGQLSSEDGTVQIIVPAGALEETKDISIQTVTNLLPGGIGNAFRILPHGEQFKKPVTLIFNYKTDDLTGTLPEFIDIAYQDAEGSWQSPVNTIIDKQNRKVSVTTTHFSDWGYFKSLMLSPQDTTVELSGSVELKITTLFPYLDPDDVQAGEAAVKILRTPRELRADEIKNWSYSGDGILISRGSQAFYTAPDNEPDANPEAVTANINLHRKGQFMLVSNITILAGHGVTYLHVDEDYKNPINNGDCMLYLYGSFGNDPGAAKRTVQINGTTVTANLWTPGIIRCRIDREISGAIEVVANNKTIARTVLRKYTGRFVYKRFQGGKANSGSSNALKEETEFNIVYRGFGAPHPPETDPIFQREAIAAFGTRADYILRGSASVTMPDQCATTTSVSLPEAGGTMLLNTISGSRDTKLQCAVKDIIGGIEIKLDFRVVDLITGVQVKRTDCSGSSLTPPRPLGVSLEGFRLEPISLAFIESGTMVLKGTNQIKSANLSSDILIEAWDGTGNPSHYQLDGLIPATFSNK